MTEHQLQKQIVEYLRLNKWIVFNLDVMVALGYIFGQKKRIGFIQHYKGIGYLKGQPDLIAVKNKRIIFFEVKTSKGKQTKEQKEVEKAIKDEGGEYYVIRSLEDVSCIIEA